MSLHVLQLGPYPPPEGGITRNMLAIREELRVSGHKCSIIATSKSSMVSGEPDVYYPGSALALTNLLRKLSADVLHLHIGGDVTKRVLSLAAACSALGGKRIVLTMHSGAYPLTQEARDADPSSVRGRIFRSFSRIIAVNEDLADVFRRFGVDENKIAVISPYSISLPDVSVMIPNELKHFVESHSPLLLAVGGLEKDYDPLFLIDAMTDIVAQFSKAGLIIAGGGSMQMEAEDAIVKSSASHAICLAGNLPHAVTLRMIDDADVMLRTTLFDGDAISVREALFLGTPVIATDNGMRPTGIHLIDAGDKAALVEKIGIIGRNPRVLTQPAIPDNSNIKAVVKLYEDLT